MDPQLLLQRLDEIGRSLERSGHALALIGMGSVGLERERLDEYSDLDFFAVVEPGFKRAYLEDLSWLSALRPISYSFMNTEDGYKLLFADGIFCEFGVFEPEELSRIPFAPGRMVWKQASIPDSIARPVLPQPQEARRDADWLLGEALTNLYVGLAREQRGEKLSATRFIQGYAVDRLLELAQTVERPGEAAQDPFVQERRFEQRFPVVAGYLSAFLQGYDRNRESALAILDFLEQYFQVNPQIVAAIRSLGAARGDLDGDQ